MKKYVVEFIGTYFLVLSIGSSVIGGLGVLAPIAIGVCLMVMVYAGGHISGAHYNPAVTIGLCIRRACSWSEAPGYIISQFLATAIAGSTVAYLVGYGQVATLELIPALLAEVIGTFALMFVILNVATSKNTEGNQYYGLAIGAVVTAMAYVFGDTSGAALNPAVAFGAGMMGMLSFSDIWIHCAGSITGALIATYVFLYVNGPD